MELCPHCKKEFEDSRALNIHITVAHVAYKIAAIEEQLAQDAQKQLEFNDNVVQIIKPMVRRFLALEKANQGLENSILELMELTKKYWLALDQEVQDEAEASIKRDTQLLKELKGISRDSAKHDHDILELIGDLQEEIKEMIKQKIEEWCSKPGATSEKA
jgi:hypothetical protein